MIILQRGLLQRPLTTIIKPRYQIHQRRNIIGFVRNALGLEPETIETDPTIENRFHLWDQSPYPQIRERAHKIMELAKCPITGKDIKYICPLSGIPTHHSREAWEADTNYHNNKTYQILKKVNIYEHDLRSGRPFPEFEFPTQQGRDRTINMSNWDLFFYTRGFYSMDTEFQLACVTKMLSYPLTIASILSQFSPYFLNPKGPITLEGLKSLAAIRYTLYSTQSNDTSGNLLTRSMTSRSSLPTIKEQVNLKNRPIRLFILGARAETQLPGYVWKQLQYLFPLQHFEIYFIGPQSFYDKQKHQYIKKRDSKPIVEKVDETLKLIHYTDYFNTFHQMKEFYPYDPFFDCFFTFHPGFASPSLSNDGLSGEETWLKNGTIDALLDTKCAIFTTGFNKADITQDMNLLTKKYGDKMDILMDPVENMFKSTKWELNDFNPQEVYQFNMFVAGFRGKRYHTTKNTRI